MSDETVNPLISTRPSDSNLHVSLHPLVLLTISDQITRHHVRGGTGPIVGALLGQQRGRELTAEHAFPCKIIEDTAGNWILDLEWMERRLQQYKDVHKAPVLELVGLFTLCPESGPTREMVALQKQVTTFYSDPALLLALHPSAFLSSGSSLTGGKLPLTVYESVVESDATKEDGSMQVDGEDVADIKFRSLHYSIETDETEMIAIDYVAKGAGSAAANVENEPITAATSPEQSSQKGKKRADAPESEQIANGTTSLTVKLTTEEEDQIAGITTRLNSVKMLQSRLALLSKFLKSQPPSYLSDPTAPITEQSPDPSSLPHLRNIQALLTRLNLLTPPTTDSIATTATTSPDPPSAASLAQANDVALSSLLALLGQDIQDMSEMGRKFSAVDSARAARGKGKVAFGGGGGGGSGAMDDGEDPRIGGFQMAGNMLV